MNPLAFTRWMREQAANAGAEWDLQFLDYLSGSMEKARNFVNADREYPDVEIEGPFGQEYEAGVANVWDFLTQPPGETLDWRFDPNRTLGSVVEDRLGREEGTAANFGTQLALGALEPGPGEFKALLDMGWIAAPGLNRIFQGFHDISWDATNKLPEAGRVVEFVPPRYLRDTPVNAVGRMHDGSPLEDFGPVMQASKEGMREAVPVGVTNANRRFLSNANHRAALAARLNIPGLPVIIDLEPKLARGRDSRLENIVAGGRWGLRPLPLSADAASYAERARNAGVRFLRPSEIGYPTVDPLEMRLLIDQRVADGFLDPQEGVLATSVLGGYQPRDYLYPGDVPAADIVQQMNRLYDPPPDILYKIDTPDLQGLRDELQNPAFVARLVDFATEGETKKLKDAVQAFAPQGSLKTREWNEIRDWITNLASPGGMDSP